MSSFQVTLCGVFRHKSNILDSREDTGQNLNQLNVEEAIQRTVDNSLSILEAIIRPLPSTNNIERTGPQEPTEQVLGNTLASNLAQRREHIGLRERSVIVFTSTPDISQSDLGPESEEASRGHSIFGAGDFQFSSVADSSVPRILPPQPPFLIYRDPVETGARPRSRSTGSRPNQIPVIQTPDSIRSTGKENVPPSFVYPNPSPYYRLSFGSNYRLSFGSREQISTDNESDSESLSQERMANEADEEFEAEKERIFKEFKKKFARLKSLLTTYDPANYDAKVLKLNKAEWMKQIMDRNDELHEVFLDLDESKLSDADKELKEKFDKDMNEAVARFISAFDLKLLSLDDTPPIERVDSRGDRSGGASSSVLMSNLNRMAEANVRVDLEKLYSEIKDLSADVKKVEDWSVVHRYDIEVAMGKLDSWRKRLKSIKDGFYSVKKIVLSNGIDEQIYSNTETAANMLESLVSAAIEQIIYEDTSRELYCLAKSKSSNVKIPSFGGNPEEDYHKWEKELKEAFKSNMIPRSDQMKKVREFLTDQAKTLIPSSEENIDECLKILKRMYGDASRVTKAKKSKLLSLGLYPNPASKKPNHVKARLDWLMSMDKLIDELFELSTKDTDSYCEVFAPTFIRGIKAFFPDTIHDRFNEVQGDSKVKLEQMHLVIKDLVSKARDLLADVEAGAGAAPVLGSGLPKTGNKSAQNITLSQFECLAAQRNELCRICKALEAEGDTNIYEEHYNRFINGCPRFAEMSVKSRRKYAELAQLCVYCLDIKAVVKKGSRHHQCKAFEKPQMFNCNASNCRVHFLVCTNHLSQNQEKYLRNVKFWEDRGKIFSTNVALQLVSPCHQTRTANKSPSPSAQGVVETDSGVKASNVFCSRTISEATKTLRKLAKGSKVRGLPAGNPLFLFSYICGKTRDLLCFWDWGCSHLILRIDVPEKELDGVKTQAGPLSISAAGDVSVQVQDEWMVLVPRTDGTKQTLIGVTCDKITSTFPKINTKEAFKEIVSKAPNAKKDEIKKLSVPDMVGGDPDLLIGVHYQCIYPEVLFTLPSGLFIAKLKLKSSNGWNAVIGGPHVSFSHHMDSVGNANQLMAYFVDGIKNFKKFGAPKMPAPLVTHEDVEFAKKLNLGELSDIVTPEVEDAAAADFGMECDIEEVSPFLSCSNCGEECDEPIYLSELEAELGADMMTVLYPDIQPISAHNADVLDLKMMMKIQEQGISLDYRCVRCRNCSDCRDAAETERISFREEMEDSVIKTCIKIDLDNKKIIARLPLRGDAAQYLSNNRESALKILNAQCKKVNNDPDAKEVVLKAFRKLLDNKFAVRFDELTKEEQERILSQDVNHWLPWRVAYKPSSVSSPARAVFDASSKTPVLPDGRGGRCLNDLTMKGRIDTLDLLNMMLRFSAASVALAGDLRMFYTSIALESDQWHLQRVLYRDGLEMDADVVELVIVTLIFGVRAVSALSETAILALANLVAKVKPRVAEMVRESRFVDDLADSDKDSETIEKLKNEADEAFESVGLKCKGWSKTGSAPHPDVTSDGVNVDVGGVQWCPALDVISVKIPPLHFGKKSRGKIQVGTEIFEGGFNQMSNFVPKQLTRRQVISKFHSLFDPYGLLVPITACMKVHSRLAVKETDNWDGVISPETRLLWVKNFWMLHSIRGLQFNRAKIPEDAANTDMILVAAIDAANDLKASAVYARFLRRNGEYSSQLLIGRSLLAKENSSIPKEELEATTIGSNLMAITRKALSKWVVDYMLVSDSMIALCWITSENKRLSLFHRNRVNQTKQHTDISKLYFCRTDHNPSDVATRAEKVQADSVGPDSVWYKGMPWMNGEVADAVAKDILKPASELRLTDNDDKEFNKGLILERTPEILVHGHAVTEERVDKMLARAEFSNYITSPSKHDFRKTVIITALVFKYVRKLKLKVNERGIGVRSEPIDKSFKMFPACFVNICWGSSKAGAPDGKQSDLITIEDVDITKSLNYWYTKATAEVIQFNKPEYVKKVGVMKDGILFCRSRIQNGRRFLQTGEFPADSLGLDIGLNLMTPLLDRWSPISYSIAMFIHNIVGKHAGYETCHRLALEYCHIIQASTLFKQIGEECSKCAMIRKKYLDVVFGPVSDIQLTIAPPFYNAMLDIWGPCYNFVPGHERETRNKRVISCKAYVMTFVCPVSKLSNLQVIEAKNSEAVLEGLIRLGCEQGFPHMLILDQDTAFMKMVTDAEVNLQDLQHRAFTEFGIRFKVAPVQGHNMIGLAERKIRAVQEIFEKIDLKNVRLHATGFQTLCKLVENNLNNLPLGYSYGRDADNSPLLKIITPNLLRIGRLNSRSLSGPIKYPKGPKEFLKKVEDTYEAFFKIWNEVYIPKLIPQPIWFKESKKLKVNDVIYFKKVANELSSAWTVGQVDAVFRGSDKMIRKVTIRYTNAGQDGYRTTDRAVRSLVRLFSIEDSYFIDDLAEVEKRMEALNSEDGALAANIVINLASEDKCGCCCKAHCSLIHFDGATAKCYEVSKMSVFTSRLVHKDIQSPDLYPDEEFLDDHEPILAMFHEDEDHALAMMCALETDFSL